MNLNVSNAKLLTDFRVWAQFCVPDAGDGSRGFLTPRCFLWHLRKWHPILFPSINVLVEYNLKCYHNNTYRKNGLAAELPELLEFWKRWKYAIPKAHECWAKALLSFQSRTLLSVLYLLILQLCNWCHVSLLIFNIMSYSYMFSVQSLCFCGEDCLWSPSSGHENCRNCTDFQWSSWRSHGHIFGVGTARWGCWTAAEWTRAGPGVWSRSLLLPVSGTKKWSWGWFLVFLHLTVVAEHCQGQALAQLLGDGSQLSWEWLYCDFEQQKWALSVEPFQGFVYGAGP